jgi:hypothetical protein
MRNIDDFLRYTESNQHNNDQLIGFFPESFLTLKTLDKLKRIVTYYLKPKGRSLEFARLRKEFLDGGDTKTVYMLFGMVDEYRHLVDKDWDKDVRITLKRLNDIEQLFENDYPWEPSEEELAIQAKIRAGRWDGIAEYLLDYCEKKLPDL